MRPSLDLQPWRPPSPTDPSTYFRKGFGLKSEVQDELAADYDGRIVDYLRSHDYTLVSGDVTIRLAREFGFCYGVERAVEYAYQTRRKFPDRRILLVGEIIHNPHVNDRMREMGIEILAHPDPTGAFDFSGLTSEDVVIMPAFGVTIDDFSALRALGCILVDTTCGSVLNVWKRVESYARDGFTALIHGKYYHEETRATASQVRKYPDGHYIIVRNMDEALMVCEYIEGRTTADALMSHFAKAVSPGFDAERHLAAHRRREPDDDVGARVAGDRRRGRRCDRAQSWRRGAGDVVPKLRHDLQRDAGAPGRGARAARYRRRRDGRDRRVQLEQHDLARGALRRRSPDVPHRNVDGDRSRCAVDSLSRGGDQAQRVEIVDWIPPGPVRVGITAGASTPNNKIGDVVTRILATRGLKAEI